MYRLMMSILMLFSFSVSGQEDYVLTFDPPDSLYGLEIDTMSNPNNVWQIGKPNKTVFTSAWSMPNVIVTDTLNSYPINDTSVFVVKHQVVEGGGFEYGIYAFLGGIYQINSDSLKDYGQIEFSPDNAVTWINLLTDTIFRDQAYSWGNAPILTGNSDGWEGFSVSLAGFSDFFDFTGGDTVQFRFSFISDSIQSNKDGLMFDDLYFADWNEAVNDLQNQFQTKVYPNPASGLVHIDFDNEKLEVFDLIIFNSNGQLVHKQKVEDNVPIYIDLSAYQSGNYYYRLVNIDNHESAYGKIVRR